MWRDVHVRRRARRRAAFGLVAWEEEDEEEEEEEKLSDGVTPHRYNFSCELGRLRGLSLHVVDVVVEEVEVVEEVVVVESKDFQVE
ncbi:unnamed protein product [Merluccius merluccius]